jgi:trigger factor
VVSQVVIKLEDISPVKKKLSFEIPWIEVKEELDAAYSNVGKKAKIKGFRPGKIPRKVLETYFRDHAEEDTVTNIINKHYWQTLENKGIIAISKPDISQEGIKENTDFAFTASFETEQDFEPQGYLGLEVEKENIKITENNLEDRLAQIRQMFATMEEIKEKRPVIIGDFVNIDFTGSMNGETFNELKADNYFLEVGSKKFIPGFEEQIVGMKSGETKSISVTFPEEYHEKKFAGKDVIFSVTVKDIKEKKLPEIDENFIKNFDKYSSLEDLKNDVRKSLEEEAGRVSQANLQNRIMDLLIKDNDFEVPASLVERQIYFMMADTHKRMTSAGMDEKNATELSIKMHDKFKDDAVKIVKSFLIIKKIAEKESLMVSDDDINNYIKDLSTKHSRDYQALKSAYEKEERKDNLRAELVQKKVFDFIEQNANIKIIEKSGIDPEVEL